MRYGRISKTGTALQASTPEVFALEIPSGAKNLWLTIKNTDGVNPLDIFEVWYRTHPDADRVAIALLAANYAAPKQPIKGCEASFATLAADTAGMLWLDVEGVYDIQLKASGSGGDVALTIHGTLI